MHSCDGASSYLMFLGLSRALSKCQSLSVEGEIFLTVTNPTDF